jgi:hypothetical protein
MRDSFAVGMCILITISAFALGWAFSASTISTECQRLHSFYVGDKTFHCIEKIKRQS